MLSKRFSNWSELGVIFCTAVLILSTLVTSTAIFGRTNDEEQIVLVKIDSTNQIDTLHSMDLDIIDRYNRYVLVEAGDDSVEDLKNADVEVDTLPGRTEISVKGHRFDIREGEPDLNSELMIDEYPEGSMGTYLVHLLGPVNPEWVYELEDMGVNILNYVPNHAYEVRMTPEMRERVESLEFVDWTGIYHPQYRIDEDIEELAEEYDSGRVRVRFVPNADIKYVEKILDFAPEAVFTMDSEFGLETIIEVEDISTVYEIAKMQDVYYISPYQEPELFSEVDSQIIGGGAWIMDDEHGDPGRAYRKHGDHGAYINQIGYTGDGVTVAVADTGLGDGTTPDAGHPDFDGRVIGGISFNESDPENWADGQSHGTHCAGSVAGDTFGGTGTQYAGHDGQYYASQGLAYDSDLFAVKIFDDRGGFLAEGEEFELIEVAKQEGDAYVHSNSWGARGGGPYDTTAEKFDRAARDSNRDTAHNEPMVLTAAAGNDGDELETVGSPSIGKNVIGIGSTESHMPDAGSYGTRGASSNPDKVSEFSSRGWAADGRVKPDVTAPGETILSTMTPEDTDDEDEQGRTSFDRRNELGLTDDHSPTEFGGSYTEDGRYEWMDGTSMANPAGAGAAAVVVEWYEETYGERPSPAMVKALMINTAQPLEEDQTGNALIDYIPNEHEGWGMIDISKLEYPKDDPIPIAVEDQESLLETGETDEHFVMPARSGEALNFTLTWTDKEAADGDDPALKNDLDLRVKSPSGEDIYHANAFNDESREYSVSSYTFPNTDTMENFDPDGTGEDSINNVLNVFIHPDEVEDGQYTIEVEGSGIGSDGNNDGDLNQDYALVVYNGEIVPEGDPPEVQVESPSEGDTWVVGEEEEILWSTSSGTDPIDSIDLHYSLDDGDSWNEIEKGIPDTGSYDWAIPDVDEESDDCLVRVRVEDEVGRYDESTNDGHFSIYYPFPHPEIEILDPGPGDLFGEDDLPVTVEWRSENVVHGHEVWLEGELKDELGSDETSYTFEGDELDDGENTVEIIGEGERESTHSRSVTFVVDTIPPELTILDPDENAQFDEDSVEVVWQCHEKISDIEKYDVRIDDGDWTEVDADENSYTFEGLDDGTHTAEVWATDEAKNEDQDSVSFTVDTTPPNIKIDNPEDGALLSQDTVTVQWNSWDETTSVEDQNITHTHDGETRKEDLDPDVYEFTLPDLEDGDHTVEITAVDELGHESSENIEFTVDTQDPEIEIISPSDEYVFANDQVTVEWETTHHGSEIKEYEVDLNQGGWEEADNETSHTFEDLEESADHEVKIRVIDEAGNEDVDEVRFTVDLTDPNIELIVPGEGDIFDTDEVEIEWQLVEEQTSGIDRYEVRGIKDGEEREWTSLDDDQTSYFFVELEDGEYTFEVKAIDEAGNEDDISANVTIDTTPPELNISSPEYGSEIDEDSVKVEWDGEPTGTKIVRYEIRVNEGEWQTLDSETSHTIEDLEDGDHTIEIKAIDEAGNERIETVEITVETSFLDSDVGSFVGNYWWLIPLIALILIILVVLVWKKQKEEEESEIPISPQRLERRDRSSEAIQEGKGEEIKSGWKGSSTSTPAAQEKDSPKQMKKVKKQKKIPKEETSEAEKTGSSYDETKEAGRETEARERAEETQKDDEDDVEGIFEEEDEESEEDDTTCPLCGNDVDPDSEKCFACGKDLTE